MGERKKTKALTKQHNNINRKKHSLSYFEIVIYKTIIKTELALPECLTKRVAEKEEKMKTAYYYLVFFSPSGAEGVFNFLEKNRMTFNANVRCFCIGETTRQFIGESQQAGFHMHANDG